MQTLVLMMAFVLPPACFDMDAEKIREIAAMPHRADGLAEQLKIYPDAGEYELTLRTDKVYQVKGEQVIKYVDGKYVVTEVMASGESLFVSVVAYDSEAEVYRKWQVATTSWIADDDRNVVTELIGIAVKGTRTVSWMLKSPSDESSHLVIEVHEDDGTTFREIQVKAGKVVTVHQGKSRKTK